MNKTFKPLSSWSWQEIVSLYKVYGQMIEERLELQRRIVFPQARIDFDDPTNVFLMRWHVDIMKICRNIDALDTEIARRNKLIGVI